MRLNRVRAELREQLTPGERAVSYGHFLLSVILPPLGVVLLVSGAKLVGGALLILGVVVMAVPMSPFMRARIRRREKQAEPQSASRHKGLRRSTARPIHTHAQRASVRAPSRASTRRVWRDHSQSSGQRILFLMSQAAKYAGWAGIAALGVVLGDGWQPQARIVGVIVFAGWVILIADFVKRHRTQSPVLRSERHDSRSGECAGGLGADRQISVQPGRDALAAVTTARLKTRCQRSVRVCRLRVSGEADARAASNPAEGGYLVLHAPSVPSAKPAKSEARGD